MKLLRRLDSEGLKRMLAMIVIFNPIVIDLCLILLQLLPRALSAILWMASIQIAIKTRLTRNSSRFTATGNHRHLLSDVGANSHLLRIRPRLLYVICALAASVARNISRDTSGPSTPRTSLFLATSAARNSRARDNLSQHARTHGSSIHMSLMDGEMLDEDGAGMEHHSALGIVMVDAVEAGIKEKLSSAETKKNCRRQKRKRDE
jgi:hypothetical protein